MLVKSSPTVRMTLRPQSHKPIAIPTPPNTRMARGVSARVCATPSEYTNQRATSGPIALLQKKLINQFTQTIRNFYVQNVIIRRIEFLLDLEYYFSNAILQSLSTAAEYPLIILPNQR